MLLPLSLLAASPSVALAITALISACSGSDSPDASNAAPQAQPLELTILHVNDHHSKLDPRDKTLKLEASNNKLEDVTVESAGFARVTQSIEELAAQSTNVIKLHAGDALTGSLYFNQAGGVGEPDAALMNTVCFDAFTLENHEFDKGDSGQKSFIDLQHKDKAGCQTPVLSANVKFGPNSALNPSRAPGYVRPSTVLERAGQKVGIVGLTIAGKTKISSSTDADTTFEDETTAAQREIDALRKQGINKIVVMSHLSYEYDQQVAKQLSGVDVVVGGDSHTLLGPDSMKTAGVGTPAQQQVIESSIAAASFLRVTQPSTKAAEVLKPFQDKVAQFQIKEVAQVPQELCARRMPGGDGSPDYSRSSANCTADGKVNVHGVYIQQLVAQAYLEEANLNYGGADISLQSAGGVRIPLQGTITAAKVIEVLPFGNNLFRLDITGQEVKNMLEDGMEAAYGPNGSTGPYPYTGGLRFDVNVPAGKGQRVSGIEVFDQVTQQWMPLDLARTYKLFVLSFNATGGDGYKTLANVPAERRMDIGVLDVDVLFNYIARQSKDSGSDLPLLLPLADDLYSTKSFIDLPRP